MAQATAPYAQIRSLDPGEEHVLCTRIRAEFREMPGLKLTLPQASRLFSIEPTRCERVLGALVHAGHLATDGTAFAQSLAGRRPV